MKILKRSLMGLLILTLICGIGAYFFARRSLAPLDGSLTLSQLSAPVTVTRDTYGIPHIKAQNRLDALHALGYVMASERLFQMDLSKRMTRGELSEIFGEIALPVDKLYRSLKLKKSALEMLEKQKSEGRFDEKQWAEMEAYFDGVNQYAANNPLPFEMALLRIKPRPFEPLDAYIMTGHMAYSFGTALKADPMMTDLAKALPYELMQELRNDPMPGPYQLVESLNKNPFSLALEGVFTPYFEGSNAWLISSKRSQSGKSIFANDPHIGYSLPAVWVEAHIQTPEFELYGHYLPLVPYAVLGHNRHHAWGFTMSLADDMDLYREQIDLKNKTALFKNKAEPLKEWTEVIKIKGQEDLNLQMIETRHGPLMDHVLAEKSLALKWAFHSPNNDPISALRKMALAQKIEDFEEALKPITAPGLNVMYADEANIAWWMAGDIAEKNNPHSDFILNGSSGQDEYVGVLPWDKKPHLINPPEGFIVTANSRPEQLRSSIRGEWQSGDRFRTIESLLNEKDLWSVDDVKALQTENYNMNNRNIRETLLAELDLTENEVGQYQDELQRLKDWNVRSDINSEAALLFYKWNNENILLMLKNLPQEQRTGYLNTSYAWNFYEITLMNENSPWWKVHERRSLITEGFQKAMASYKKGETWGELHQVEYQHPLGRSFPLNKILNVGPLPIPGAYNEINNNKMRGMGGDFKVVAGPSTRRIIDFAQPQKSWGINPVGISGHLLSPFYRDQAQLFIDGKYRAQLLQEEDIEKEKTHRLILNP